MNPAKIISQRFAGNLGKRSGKLQPGCACTHDDEGQPGTLLFLGGGALGAFKRIKNLVPNRRGLLDRFQTRRPLPPRVVPVIRSLRARGHDQRVIRIGITVTQNHALRNRVHVHGFPEKDARIFLTAQDASQRRGNFSRRKRARRHLIKQRLKQMKVSPVDKRHVHRGALQFLCRGQSAKAPA